MKKYLFILFAAFTSLVGAQEYNNPCVACAEAQGYYCGDDESNWTQYSPEGCVQNDWLNDGWEDCIDAGDENGSVPTPITECLLDIIECDTIYIDIPVIEYVEVIEYDTVFIEIEVMVYDTIVEVEYVDVIVPEYLDCYTGLPCTSGMIEIIKESEGSNLIYNLQGKVVHTAKGLYIQNGTVKWHK